MYYGKHKLSNEQSVLARALEKHGFQFHTSEPNPNENLTGHIFHFVNKTTSKSVKILPNARMMLLQTIEGHIDIRLFGSDVEANLDEINKF